MPTVDQMFGRPLAPAPWLPSHPVLDLAVAAIPVVTDDLAASVIVQMAETIVDLREELQGVRSVQAAALARLRQQHLEAVRLRARLSARQGGGRAA